MLGKKIEPIINELSKDTGHLAPKINELIRDYMQFKQILEQKINELQTTLTETNMQIAQIAAASGSKTLVEANYERPPVDDFEKEFGKMQTTDDKANLGPMDAPKFEDGENPFE